MTLLAPILLLLIMAVWEFGRAWNVYQTMTDAAREGARMSVVANADPTLPTDVVETTIHNALAAAKIDTTQVLINKSGFRLGIGVPSLVSITLPYQFGVVGYLLSWTTGQKSITMNTTVLMRNE